MRRQQGEEEEATVLQIHLVLVEDSEMRMRERARPREHVYSGSRANLPRSDQKRLNHDAQANTVARLAYVSYCWISNKDLDAETFRVL
jgi:hypothetical protein